MSNAMSLKAKIRNIAKSKNIPAQVILQNYMFERLLIRLSKTDYRDKFVLKGGMLVAAIVGLDNRATMDLDTTLKNLPLAPDAIRGTEQQISDINTIFSNLIQSKELRQMWNNYRKQFSYASGIEYDAIISIVSELVK